MKVHPMQEEIADLRHKVHIMNAEKFCDTKKEHLAMVDHIESLIKNGNVSVSTEKYEKFLALCRKGKYYSIRGHQSFVRYTMHLKEVNGSLRLFLDDLFTGGN